MKILVVITLLCLIHCSYGSSPHHLSKREASSSLIMKGFPVQIEQYPFAALLDITRNFTHVLYCGGSIISPIFVLTAGSCLLLHPLRIIITVGSATASKDGTQYISVHNIKHPQFDYMNPDYDIGLVQAQHRISLNHLTIAPAALVNIFYRAPAHEMLFFLGWGNQKPVAASISTHLMALKVPIIPLAECQRIYNNASVHLSTRSFCAGYTTGNKGICYGDTGGPIVNSKNRVVGILAGVNDCTADEPFPPVFTNLGNLAIRFWIRQTTGIRI